MNRIFIFGVIVTMVGSCMLGTIIETAENVEELNRSKPKVIYDNRVLKTGEDEKVHFDKTVPFTEDKDIDLDATLVLPESEFEKMGLEVNKDKHDNSKNAVSTAKRGSDVMQLKEPIAFCVKCGAKNQPDSVYCYSCGNKLA